MFARREWQYKSELFDYSTCWTLKHAVFEYSETHVPKVQIMQGQTHLMQISPSLFVRPLEPTVCINVCRGHALSNFNALCFWHPNLTVDKCTLFKYELNTIPILRCVNRIPELESCYFHQFIYTVLLRSTGVKSRYL